jgi:hypothetical protein
MANMQSEVYEAFRSIDIPEDKAMKTAGALAKRDDDVGALKADVQLIKWMLGFVLAMLVAILFKLFTHCPPASA